MSNFLNSAAQSAATPLDASSGTSNPPTVSSPQDLKRFDLIAIKSDKSLSLHKLLKTRIALDSFIANVMVIDLDQVYLSDEAAAALARCYLTAAYLLDRFGNHYKKNIVAEATRGNLKGMKYINAEANEYAHSTDDGMEIVVTGKCVELDSVKKRQIHITCRAQKLSVAPESVGQ